MLRLAVLLVHGRRHDVTIFTQWALVLQTFGTHGLYDRVTPWSPVAINYPPGYALLLVAVVWLGRALGSPGGGAGLIVLLKLPAILADLGCAALGYAIARRFSSQRDALVAAALATFGPWTWPVSAIQGQVDAVCALFLLLALRLSLAERFTASWAALAVGALVKPFPLVVAPLLAAAQLRAGGVSARTLAGPLLGLGLAYAAALPFAPSAAPVPVLRWLAHEYGSGQDLFPATSFFAANLWTLAGTPGPDTARFAGVSLHVLGWLAFAALEAVLVAGLLRRGRARVEEGPASAHSVAAWMLALLGLFILTTRMHERYLAYALSVAVALWGAGRAQQRVVAVLAVTFACNYALAYVLGAAGPHGFTTLAVRLVSASNVAVFCYALWTYVRSPALRR